MNDDSLQEPLRLRLRRVMLALLLVTIGGTAGYVAIEGWNVVDALYMTVITLSTVGFGEVRPLSAGGRLFTALLIVAGVGVVAYLFGTAGQYLIGGELRGTLRRRRMDRILQDLKGHLIVCGFGRVGRQVAVDLEQQGRRFVVVEADPNLLEDDEERLHVIGDAADDEVLKRAGIDHAHGLVAATGDDATNIFITLTAHTINPEIVIVARSNQTGTEPKLLKAGANHVISPYGIAGRRIATQLLHPSVVDFLDVVMHSGQLELWLEEIRVGPGGELDGKTVAECDLRGRTGVNVLALRRREGDSVLISPPSDLRFEGGDVMIALGTRDQLQKAGRLARRSR